MNKTQTVPLEPTEAMTEAGCREFSKVMRGVYPSTSAIQAAWDAMVAAAGEPKTQEMGAAGGKAGDEWATAERIRDLPAVDDAIRNFLIDSTGTNSTCMVREVLRAAATPQGMDEPKGGA